MAKLPSAYSQRPIRRAPSSKTSVSAPTPVLVPAAPTPEPEVELEVEAEATPEPVVESVSKSSIQSMTKVALSKKASELGLQFSAGARKDELVRIICEHLNLN